MPTDRHAKERKILRRFVRVFCKAKHGGADGPCPECQELLLYAEARLDRCPHDPKPACRKCPIHCYAPAYRARIQQVMRFSGTYFVKRGRIDWLVRHFLQAR